MIIITISCMILYLLLAFIIVSAFWEELDQGGPEMSAGMIVGTLFLWPIFLICYIGYRIGRFIRYIL